jgi:hypothetical protein
MSLIVVLNSMYVNGLIALVNEFNSCIHIHLECCRCISLWVS